MINDIVVACFQLNLTIERKYGSRHSIDVFYDIVPISAVPGTNYLVPDSMKLRFRDGQTVANISILLPRVESKRRRKFNVEITSALQPQDIYKGIVLKEN